MKKPTIKIDLADVFYSDPTTATALAYIKSMEEEIAMNRLVAAELAKIVKSNTSLEALLYVYAARLDQAHASYEGSALQADINSVLRHNLKNS